MSNAPRLRLASETASRPEETPSGTLEELFRAHGAYVSRVCHRILGRPDEVEDLVQQTFLDAQRALHRLRHPEAAKAWLLTMAVRLARRHLRLRRLRQWVRLDDVPTYEEVADRTASPSDRVLLAQIYSVLDGLPVNERLAWTLRQVEGESLDRVALLCGCSLATAKRRVAAAQRAIEEACADE